ncbi:lipoprotein [Malikia sp.]|nr:lipoprotein [Malikia sp.]MDD2729217.1 lipoprotein [Malikia sp.]
MACAGRKALAGLCAAALLTLAGCGQKGPLYLPDPAAAQPAPATSR